MKLKHENEELKKHMEELEKREVDNIQLKKKGAKFDHN